MLMTRANTATGTTAGLTFDKETLGQVVLVFQGGGALGAYQAGVYEALHEAGHRARLGDRHLDRRDQRRLIAGNEPGERMARCASSGARSSTARSGDGLPPGAWPGSHAWCRTA